MKKNPFSIKSGKKKGKSNLKKKSKDKDAKEKERKAMNAFLGPGLDHFLRKNGIFRPVFWYFSANINHKSLSAITKTSIFSY